MSDRNEEKEEVGVEVVAVVASGFGRGGGVASVPRRWVGGGEGGGGEMPQNYDC